MPHSFQIPILSLEQYTLSNGLRVVLNADAAPVVSVAVYYDVGSRNEREDRTGFAHLFEHMMFQGSENVPKAGHFQHIMKAGGTMNGTTSSERTNYYETMPADQLPLALWLESDRMRSLAVTQENLDNQREAVKEEKRLRYDNQPYGQIFDLINEMIYGNFANAHSTIGSMDHLDAASVEDVQEFFRIYYAPNNAVLVLSGSFDVAEAKNLVEAYFGDIPSQPIPPPLDVSEPAAVVAKFREWEDKLAPFPAFLIGWKIPARRSREFYALYLAGKILYEGDSSRLYQKLVKGDEAVIQLFGFTDERRGPSSIFIGAIPKPDKDLSKIRETIMLEIEDLAIHGPKTEEMEKIENQLINDSIRMRQSSMARAQQIAEFALYDGDPGLINTELDLLLAVTKNEIRDAVGKFLNTGNRSLLNVKPAGGERMTLINRQSPPEPLAPISFEIEQPFRSKLANGLEVVIFPNDKLPLVSFRLAFQSGDIHDPADAKDLTTATTSMLTEGTSVYTSAQLAEKIERLGAGLSAYASDDFTTIAASCLSLYSEEILHLVADVVLRPTFPEDELDLYRRNTIEHLKFQRSQPAFLANEQSARLIYGEHPYANISPRAEDIQKLGREKLTAFHHQRFIASNAMLIAVGDVEPDALIKDLDDLFGDWKQGSAPESVTASTAERAARTITVVDRPGSAQSNIVIGNLAIKRTDPDYFPMLVMNQVLGAGASSRVFMNLREEKGYTYGAYTRLETKKLAGDFEATAEVRSAVTGESLREFFLEFDRIRQESVGEVELDDAKNFLTGVFPLRAETQEGLTNLIVNQHLYSLPDDYLQTYRDNVRGVSAAEVRRVAQGYIRTEEMAIVIVGDAEEVLPQVQTYADSIEVFDTEGNRK